MKHHFEMNCRIEELMEEYQVQIIRFINHCASETDEYCEDKFRKLAKML